MIATNVVVTLRFIQQWLNLLLSVEKSSDNNLQKENENIWEFLVFLIYNINMFIIYKFRQRNEESFNFPFQTASEK